MGNFFPNWTVKPENTKPAESLIGKAFEFQKTAGGHYVTGLYARYPPEGYVATLGKYTSKVIKSLNDLNHNDWIDRQTKALIIDTVTHNANTNLFTRIRILMEQPSMGSVTVSGDIRSFVLYSYVGDAGMITLMLQFLWIIIVTYMTVKMVKGLIKERRAYFATNPWNTMRFIGILMSVIAAVTFVIKVVFAMKLIEQVKNEFGEFFSEC